MIYEQVALAGLVRRVSTSSLVKDKCLMFDHPAFHLNCEGTSLASGICFVVQWQVVMLSWATVGSNPHNSHAPPPPLISKSVSVSSMPQAHFVVVV